MNRQDVPQKVINRFWQHVNIPDKCWEWDAMCMNTGYGLMYTSKDQPPTLAHRMSYILHYGSIPEGLLVLHACDNRKCVNPNHLWVGTHQDNSDDKWKKGRAIIANGQRRRHSNLRVGEVLLIKKILKADIVSNPYIGKMFKSASSTIWKISSGRSWKGVS